MASATPAADVPGQSTELTKERGVWGLRPACWVAESSRRDDQSCRSWHPKNQIILSVIVMLVTGTGDKVVYRLGRSKGRSRTPTSCAGPTRGRRGDRSPLLIDCSREVLIGKEDAMEIRSDLAGNTMGFKNVWCTSVNWAATQALVLAP